MIPWLQLIGWACALIPLVSGDIVDCFVALNSTFIYDFTENS